MCRYFACRLALPPSLGTLATRRRAVIGLLQHADWLTADRRALLDRSARAFPLERFLCDRFKCHWTSKHVRFGIKHLSILVVHSCTWLYKVRLSCFVRYRARVSDRVITGNWVPVGFPLANPDFRFFTPNPDIRIFLVQIRIGPYIMFRNCDTGDVGLLMKIKMQ